MQLAQPAIDQRHLVGERRQLVDIGGELEQAHLVLRAHDGMGKPARRVRLVGHILFHAAAGVDGQRDVQRKLRLPLEDRNLLRPAVFGYGKVVARKAADNGAVLVRHVHKKVHQLHVHMKRGLLRV